MTRFPVLTDTSSVSACRSFMLVTVHGATPDAEVTLIGAVRVSAVGGGLWSCAYGLPRPNGMSPAYRCLSNCRRSEDTDFSTVVTNITLVAGRPFLAQRILSLRSASNLAIAPTLLPRHASRSFRMKMNTLRIEIVTSSLPGAHGPCEKKRQRPSKSSCASRCRIVANSGRRGSTGHSSSNATDSTSKWAGLYHIGPRGPLGTRTPVKAGTAWLIEASDSKRLDTRAQKRISCKTLRFPGKLRTEDAISQQNSTCFELRAHRSALGQRQNLMIPWSRTRAA